jgi:hypothetical protein
MPSSDRVHFPFASLLAVQVPTVALAIAKEGAIAIGALAAVCSLSAVTAIRFHERLDFMPEVLMPAFIVAALLPWAVWKGDPAFGRAFLWTLPVRRQRAAVAKVASGALWLMLAMIAAFLILALMAVSTGGRVGIDEVRLVSGTRDLQAAVPVHWTTPLWMWLTPFGGALILYLASSALLLGLRHPVRWIAGVAATFALLIALVVNFGPDSGVGHGLARLLGTLWGGKYGFDFAMSGGSAALVEDVQRPGGGSEGVWTALPDAGRWAAAFAVWLGGTLIAVALSLRRHWER